MRPTRSGGGSSPRSRYTRMLRVVVPASRARSSIRYSPDALVTHGSRLAASNNCATMPSTRPSTRSRDWRPTRRGARRRLASRAAMPPAGWWCDGRSAGMSGRRPRARPGRELMGGCAVVVEPEIPHLPKILRGESRIHRGVEAVPGQIPAAATRHPGGVLEPPLDTAVVPALYVLAHVEEPQILAQDRRDCGHRVVELALDVGKQ